MVAPRNFVTPDMDEGPIILQAAVPVLDDDTETSLAARVLAEEHRSIPRPCVCSLLAASRLRAPRSGLAGWLTGR